MATQSDASPQGGTIEDALASAFADPALEGRRIELRTRQTLFEPWSEARDVYFVNQGQIRLYNVRSAGAVRLIEILGPGQMLGIPAFAGNNMYQARAVAFGRSIVTAVDAHALLESLDKRPNLCVDVMRRLARGLEGAREEAASLVFDDCTERLIKTLLRFSHSVAATPEGDEVVLHLTHQQLAQAVGAARETVSLALTEMRRKDLVRTGRNRLRFRPVALRHAFLNQQTPLQTLHAA